MTTVNRTNPFRQLVLASALAAGLVLGQPSGTSIEAGGVPTEEGLQATKAIRDLSSLDDATVTAAPEHLPEPARATGIGPGSHLIVQMPRSKDDPTETTFGCTANFIWTASGSAKGGRNQTSTKLYLGSAGHCFLPPGFVSTHGAGADYNPSRTSVSVCVDQCDFGGRLGFEFTGTLVELGRVAYARQGEDRNADGDTDEFEETVGRDFGIVEIPARLSGLVRPSMPVWGGPTTIEEIELGSIVCHYGAGVIVGETWPTMARAGQGASTDTGEGHWFANTATAPGDSGSAIQVCAGEAGGLHGRGAAGLITHLIIALDAKFGLAESAGTTVARAIELAARDAKIKLTLVTAQQ